MLTSFLMLTSVDGQAALSLTSTKGSVTVTSTEFGDGEGCLLTPKGTKTISNKDK